MSTVKDYYIGINTIFKFSKQRLRAPKIGPTILVPSAHSVLSHQTKKIKKVMPNRAKLPRGKDQMVPTQLFSLSLLLSLPNSPAFSHFHCLSLCLSHHRVDWPRTQLWVKVNLFILFRSACKIWFFFFSLIMTDRFHSLTLTRDSSLSVWFPRKLSKKNKKQRKILLVDLMGSFIFVKDCQNTKKTCTKIVVYIYIVSDFCKWETEWSESLCSKTVFLLVTRQRFYDKA